MAPLGDVPHISDSSFDRVSCQARDEAADLRNGMCQLRVRLEEVEDERNYNAAKANELEEVIRAFKQEHVHEELVKKSLQLAEISMTINSLQSQMKSMKDEKAKLLLARSRDKKNMEDLSDVIRSLQCRDDGESSDEEEEEIVLTPQKALDMTLKNMKAHIEFLEDELQDRAVKCSDQDKEIVQLQKENEMKNIKIEMLEELFRSLNDGRQHEEEEEKLASSPLEKHLVTSTPQKVSRGNRPEMAKARSWDNLLGKSSKSEPGVRRERRMNRRSNSSRSLKDDEYLRGPLHRAKREDKSLQLLLGIKKDPSSDPMWREKPDGVGTVRFSNGDTYLGEVKYGKLHGKGTLYSKSGISRGSFINSVFLG